MRGGRWALGAVVFCAWLRPVCGVAGAEAPATPQTPGFPGLCWLLRGGEGGVGRWAFVWWGFLEHACARGGNSWNFVVKGPSRSVRAGGCSVETLPAQFLVVWLYQT